ncbi:MAG: SAM-dependent methyltransferase [Sphingobacteriales bacterium]|jgi:SAM-dependent methyltransferase
MKYSALRHRIHEFCGGSRVKRILVFYFIGFLFVRSWHIRKAIWAWARKAPSRPLNILEAGGGLGQWPYRLTRMNNSWNVVSVDSDLLTVSEGNQFFQKCRINKGIFLHESLENHNKPNAYDMALLVDVVQCYKSTENLLKKVHSNLRPCGNLILTTFTKTKGKAFVSLHNKGEKEEYYSKDGFSMAGLKKILKEQGFRRIKAHYFMGNYGLWSWRIGFQFPLVATRSSFGLFCFYLLPFYYLLALPICGLLNIIDSTRVNRDGIGLIFYAEAKKEQDEC